jgi:hypothetical protein
LPSRQQKKGSPGFGIQGDGHAGQVGLTPAGGFCGVTQSFGELQQT